MKRFLIGGYVLIIMVLTTAPLFADVDELSGNCTLPIQAGVSIQVSAYQGGPALLSTVTNRNGYYNVNCESLSAGTYYFYATDGVGTHLWQFYYSGSGDISHNFSLSV